jgi:predicted Zn finger-like uncharacterized protein
MIIGCPVCRTRYLVDEQALRSRAGRTVRCATCGHTWHQAAPPELLGGDAPASLEGPPIEPALEVPPRPEVLSEASLDVPRRPGATLEASTVKLRRWGSLRWFLLIVLCALAILAGVVIARRAVVKILPQAARVFALAGLPVEPSGELRAK